MTLYVTIHFTYLDRSTTVLGCICTVVIELNLREPKCVQLQLMKIYQSDNQ